MTEFITRFLKYDLILNLEIQSIAPSLCYIEFLAEYLAKYELNGKLVSFTSQNTFFSRVKSLRCLQTI